MGIKYIHSGLHSGTSEPLSRKSRPGVNNAQE